MASNHKQIIPIRTFSNLEEAKSSVKKDESQNFLNRVSQT